MPHPIAKLATLLLLCAALAHAQEKPGSFRNPINPSADPWMNWHDGHYHLATTQGGSIKLWRSPTIAGLKDAEPKTLWEGGKGVWAPEFHRFPTPRGDRWFCYFTQTDGPDENHRMFVMRSNTSRIHGSYSKPVQILTDPDDKFYAIDGTVMSMPGGKNYFLWAAHPGHTLRIAEMKDPFTLKGPGVLLPASGFGCPEVREGPFAIRHGQRIFLTYSACDTGKPDYAVGALWTTIDSDPMDPASWVQIETPLLRRNDENHVFGPGHHSFFKSPDGSEDWIAYHAKTTSEYTYRGRTTRVQKLSWDADGMPIPVVPASLDTHIDPPSGDPATRKTRK